MHVVSPFLKSPSVYCIFGNQKYLLVPRVVGTADDGIGVAFYVLAFLIFQVSLIVGFGFQLGHIYTRTLNHLIILFHPLLFHLQIDHSINLSIIQGDKDTRCDELHVMHT